MKTLPPGKLPAVILVDPKYPHNVGAALRACSCFGLKQLWWTGSRVTIDPVKGERLPREERMKGYKEVALCPCDTPLEYFGETNAVPVAVEVRQNSEPLTTFEHPENAVYVFGPEDGSIPKAWLHLCHRFVHIPANHCLNLSTGRGGRPRASTNVKAVGGSGADPAVAPAVERDAGQSLPDPGAGRHGLGREIVGH